MKIEHLQKRRASRCGKDCQSSIYCCSLNSSSYWETSDVQHPLTTHTERFVHSLFNGAVQCPRHDAVPLSRVRPAQQIPLMGGNWLRNWSSRSRGALCMTAKKVTQGMHAMQPHRPDAGQKAGTAPPLKSESTRLHQEKPVLEHGRVLADVEPLLSGWFFSVSCRP